jgi:hypothetical protein
MILTMSSTPVGRVGRITHAAIDPSEAGSFVEILDDSDGSTGGAYVCIWAASGGGADMWVEHLDEVDQIVTESGWAVEWFDEVPPEAEQGRPHHA